MKKLKLFTSLAQFATGAVIVLYSMMLMKQSPDLSYLRYAMAVGVFLIIISLAGFLAKKVSTRILLFPLHACFYAVFLSLLAFFVMIMTGMFANGPKGCDYLIVPGAAVNGNRPSEALEKRIEKAYEYMDSNPKSICIATGAVEEDGEISEAECTAEGLMERGIASERIVREELSTTTVENMKNAVKFVQGANNGVLVVTSGFHVFRSCMILKNFTKFPVYGCSASGLNSYSVYNMTREFVVFLIDVGKGNYRIKF